MTPLKRIIDLTHPITAGMPVYPGDPAVRFTQVHSINEGGYNVSEVSMGTHTGTHIDAPFHFSMSGETAEAIPLEHCIGPCEVLPLTRLATAKAERVLVKAAGGAPTAQQVRALPNLKLFGTDGPSVDPMDSKTLDAHHALWKRGVVILEGLVLASVPDGSYELIALPLKLVDMDAAPVRAILIER